MGVFLVGRQQPLHNNDDFWIFVTMFLLSFMNYESYFVRNWGAEGNRQLEDFPEVFMMLKNTLQSTSRS